MTTIAKTLSALTLAATLIAAGNAYAHGHGGGRHGDGGNRYSPPYHQPVHGPGSSHNPIAYHPVHGAGSSHDPIIVQPTQPVHGAGSSHDPIICKPGARPGSLDCRHQGRAR